MRSVKHHKITGHSNDGRTVLIHLDDGTDLEITGTSYESPELEVTHLTPKVLEERAKAEKAERKRRKAEVAAAAKASARRRAHIDEMRSRVETGAMTSAEFEKWRRATYPTLDETLRDVWTGPRMAEQVFGS
jgi:hypothetical protein